LASSSEVSHRLPFSQALKKWISSEYKEDVKNHVLNAALKQGEQAIA